MEKEIKYIGFYDVYDSQYKRNSCLSAVDKMNYIAKSIVSTGRKVKIISPAWYVDEHAPITNVQKKQLYDNITLIQGPSFPTKNKITMILKRYFSLIWIFIYLIVNVKKNEKILAYHSLALIRPLYWAKKIKKFKLIYEVEEIYTDVIQSNDKLKNLEIKFISTVDEYIFPTELLNEKLNYNNKPSVIVYGSYEVKKNRNSKFDDDKIHAVYAGTFDSRKGGAAAAVKAAEYLDEKYHIHIIGFGSKDEKIVLQNLIKEVSKKTKCTVTYDGLYKGEEYIKFLQKCNIGLSTQTPDAEYNDTSFPSKVLSYMSNGLRVVSIRIKALEKATISKLLYYYDKDCPKEIAKAIKSIDYNGDYDSRFIIKTLDTEFTEDLKHLLEV